MKISSSASARICAQGVVVDCLFLSSFFLAGYGELNRSQKGVGLAGKPAAENIDTELPHTFRNPPELLLVQSQ